MEYTAKNAIVATTPRNMVTHDGLSITSFRVASSFQSYSKGDPRGQTFTNWLTVIAFGDLADELRLSIRKGNRIDATGVLLLREWDNGSQTGTSAEIELTSYKQLTKSEEPAHECNCQKCPA